MAEQGGWICQSYGRDLHRNELQMGTRCHQGPHLSRPEIFSSHSRWLQRLSQEKDHNNLQLQLLPSFVWSRDFKCELTAAVKAFHKIEKRIEICILEF